MSTPEDVLRFWFGEGDDPYSVDEDVSHGWFAPTEAFDAEVRERFGDDIAAAVRGERDGWSDTPQGALALVILLDQLTRNAYRGTARMYEGDERARQVTLTALESGQDQALRPVERTFLYLPLEHAEDLALQNRCVELFEELASDAPKGSGVAAMPRWAHSHRRIIERFGRFPHRNEILGRQSTPEEQAFLDSDAPKY